LADFADVQRLAGDRDIAATTLRIPHPYEDGMTYEGCLRQHLKKWGVYEDLDTYGILRSEFETPK